MKKYTVEISQNGWEYTGYAFIECNELKKTGDESIIADGVNITFDEQVGRITEENIE